jgi:hypothetical protein
MKLAKFHIVKYAIHLHVINAYMDITKINSINAHV